MEINTNIQPIAPAFAFQNVNPFPSITNFHSNTGSIPLLTSAATYTAVTNLIYLARRSNVRKMSKRELWQIRTTRDPGVSIRLYIAMLLAWQFFVLIFPIVEPIAKSFSHVSFLYTYPNAGGVGVILEPLDIQHLKGNKRAKHQIRFDWHRFSLNMGDIGRDGYRHPPSKVLNLPHLDIPQRGMKHWPWKKRHLNHVQEKQA